MNEGMLYESVHVSEGEVKDATFQDFDSFNLHGNCGEISITRFK